MEETILYPSPNWFLPSVLAASEDGWLVYGGPIKSVVVLEPLSPDLDGVLLSKHRFRAHVVHKTHYEKVVSVDISPEWPEKRHFVTGSVDGTIKLWSITQVENKCHIKNIQTHETHSNEKEEVVGVGYSKATHVISVGSFSNLVVWDLNTNVKNSYTTFMRHFKATCMSCSPHLPLHVAVGTKQGVVFVLNLYGKGRIVYKVRGQDDEISQVTWCPQFEVSVKKSFQEKKSVATQRLEKIRNEPEPSDLDESGVQKKLPEDSFDESIAVPEDDMFDIYKDHEDNEFGHKKYQPEDVVVKTKVDDDKDDFLAECEKLKAQILKNKDDEEESIESLVEAIDKAHIDKPVESKNVYEAKMMSGVASLAASGSKLLQHDGSDHVHKHLLASISKNGFSVRIWSKTGKIVASCGVAVGPKNANKSQNKVPQFASLHWHSPEVLLIADGKVNLLECNPLRVDCRNRLVWKVIASAHRRSIYYITSARTYTNTQASSEVSTQASSEVSTQDSSEVSTQASSEVSTPASPQVSTQASPSYAWSAGQDRFLVCYDVASGAVVAKYSTCGGFLYDVRACPYDAAKLSVSVGDGAVRVCELQTTGEDEARLALGEVSCYWHNVQGKVLQTAWHPTKENLLAYSTAESRVGIIDTSKTDRPAKVLQTALTHGVYSIAWGDGMQLYAIGGKEFVMYNASKPETAPVPIQIEIEGQRWEPYVVSWSGRGLTVGSSTGGVALFSGPGGSAQAARFVFTRPIQAVEWHPTQTSSSDEESPYKDLLAISSTDKINHIVILKLEHLEGGGKRFTDFATLSGHTDKVLQVYWSPHRDEQILSTSQDSTVRVWDVSAGACVSVFAGHAGGTLGAAWCAAPSLPRAVLSGGNDFCLRLWDARDYPADNYKVTKKEPKKRKKTKPTAAGDDKDSDEDNNHEDKDDDNKETKENKQKQAEEDYHSDEEPTMDGVLKIFRSKTGKKYILPMTSRHLYGLNVQVLRLVLRRHLLKNREHDVTALDAEDDGSVAGCDLDCLKIFGNINEVNEMLDKECESHLQLKCYKEYTMLMIFRGRIDSVVQFANDNDLLDPFLLSVAPCVSFKYWKDVMQMYIAQIDRLAARKIEDIVSCSPSGSPRSSAHPAVFRKAAAMLAVHDVRGAVGLLQEANLHKEAYVLCRCRHMDSIAEEVIQKWASHVTYSGNLVLGALLHIVMGKISEAATLLRRSANEEHLTFAAELAKLAGLNTFADYMETKAKNIPTQTKPEQESTEQILHDLPTKMELLLRENTALNGESDVENGNSVNGETNGN